jgi:hypothetical protein
VAVIICILDLPGHHVELSIKPQGVNTLILFGFLISPPFAFLQINLGWQKASVCDHLKP